VAALEITTAKVCPPNCAPHCPQEKFRDAYGIAATQRLSYDDFQRAIETVPTDVRIDFSGFCEPFVNNRALDMMEHARRKGHAIALYSTLLALTADGVDRIRRLAPEIFVVHLPDNLGITKVRVDAAYMAVLGKVLTETNVTGFSRMGDNFVTNERAGNCENVAPRHMTGPIWCGKLDSPAFVMLPNCDVVLCCMDWTIRHRVGNLLSQSWAEVVAGPEYSRVRRERWRWDGESLCRSCKWAEPLLSVAHARRLLGGAVAAARGDTG
jgi:Iron-sulfur cluster-binding domain